MNKSLPERCRRRQLDWAHFWYGIQKCKIFITLLTRISQQPFSSHRHCSYPVYWSSQKTLIFWVGCWHCALNDDSSFHRFVAQPQIGRSRVNFFCSLKVNFSWLSCIYAISVIRTNIIISINTCNDINRTCNYKMKCFYENLCFASWKGTLMAYKQMIKFKAKTAWYF